MGPGGFFEFGIVLQLIGFLELEEAGWPSERTAKVR